MKIYSEIDFLSFSTLQSVSENIFKTNSILSLNMRSMSDMYLKYLRYLFVIIKYVVIEQELNCDNYEIVKMRSDLVYNIIYIYDLIMF